MRFKEFIREARHREDISIEKATELLASQASDADNRFDNPLWRGSKNMTEEAYIINGEAGNRTSANTSNHYTLIMDRFLPPHDYPKRSKSIILANDANKDYARGFGTRYAIFPYDGVKIGVCSDNDLWHTYLKIGNAREITIEDWNNIFKNLRISDENYVDLKFSIMSEMSENEFAKSTSSTDEIFFKAFGNNMSKVESILRDAYSPESLKLHLATSADIEKYEDTPRELWISGKCIAIREDIWEKMGDDRNIR